jgi:RNA polymerase primary sigma factor
MDALECTADKANRFLRFFEPSLNIEELLEAEPEMFTDHGMAEEEMFGCHDKIQIRNTVKKLLAGLKPKEAEVLILRFGLNDDKERTLEEIGEIYNVTRERIRQIEANALCKLRHPIRSQSLRPYYDN